MRLGLRPTLDQQQRAPRPKNQEPLESAGRPKRGGSHRPRLPTGDLDDRDPRAAGPRQRPRRGGLLQRLQSWRLRSWNPFPRRRMRAAQAPSCTRASGRSMRQRSRWRGWSQTRASVKSRPMSQARTEWVRAPTLTASTERRESAWTRSSVMPPETSMNTR